MVSSCGKTTKKNPTTLNGLLGRVELTSLKGKLPTSRKSLHSEHRHLWNIACRTSYMSVPHESNVSIPAVGTELPETISEMGKSTAGFDLTFQ